MTERGYNEAPTEYIRRVLAETKCEFYADLFAEISNSSAILYKFMLRGEIELVRWQHNGRKSYKIYRVAKLKEFKNPMKHSAKKVVTPRKKNVVPLHPVMQNWKDAFPDMFAVPEFKILGKTSHKLEMNYDT